MRLYLINLPGLYFHLQLEQTVSGVARGQLGERAPQPPWIDER